MRYLVFLPLFVLSLGCGDEDENVTPVTEDAAVEEAAVEEAPVEEAPVE